MSKTTITPNLGKDLKKALKGADEIWVGTALMTEGGLNLIQDAVSSKCKQHYLLGIDLPTHPKVFTQLQKQDLQKTEVSAKVMLNNKEFYHPKVYIIRKKTDYTAFVSSANATDAGFSRNYEMSVRITDEKACKKLIQWFEKTANFGSVISYTFLQTYKVSYAERKKLMAENRKKVKSIVKKTTKELSEIMSKHLSLVQMVNEYRNSEYYQSHVKERGQVVKDLRVVLDYPNFENIELDKFYDIWHLGHLIPIKKNSIRKEIPALRKLLRMLINEEEDIVTRYDKAYSGKYKVKGVGPNFLTKVLTMHRPKEYCVINSMSERTLSEYGLLIPRGTSKGEKYKMICDYLKEINKETDIKDFSVLDYALYWEAEKIEQR